MNNSCPECGAVYSVTSKDVGRRIACKKCRSALIVSERGLERDDAVLAEVEDDLEPRGRGRDVRSGPGFFERMKNFADVPTILFGAGAFFVIYFLFSPLIDQAKIIRREGAVSEGQLETDRLLRNTKAEDAKKKIDDDWKKERDLLREEVDFAKVGAQRGGYWNRQGMLLGFLLLAFACLGYLTPHQPTIRRVVGAIVLCSMLVLIFLMFTLIQR